MKIVLIGGTGGLGKALALRWCLKHNIIIGSRVGEKAIDSAHKYDLEARRHYGSHMSGNIKGMSNDEAVKIAEILVLTIPYQNVLEISKNLKRELPTDSLIISPVVPMIRNSRGFSYSPPHTYNSKLGSGKMVSIAEAISNELPSHIVVSGFHTIPEKLLANLSLEINMDVFLTSDDIEAATKVSKLVKEIPGLRPIYVGQLEVSSLVECMTPLLLNISKNNDIKNPSIKII